MVGQRETDLLDPRTACYYLQAHAVAWELCHLGLFGCMEVLLTDKFDHIVHTDAWNDKLV